jgi:hypothetical protein
VVLLLYKEIHNSYPFDNLSGAQSVSKDTPCADDNVQRCLMSPLVSPEGRLGIGCRWVGHITYESKSRHCWNNHYVL